MVDVPFVSEEFQKAFRNQFPAQASSGRDLHVSDVVIPVVDFTPTSSGASLPTDLARALSTGTYWSNTTLAKSKADLITTPGFYEIRINASFSPGTSAGGVNLHLEDNTGAYSAIYGETVQNISSSFGYNAKIFVTVFLPATYKVVWDLYIGSGVTAEFGYNQVADVNGNLIQPPLYNPQ